MTVLEKICGVYGRVSVNQAGTLIDLPTILKYHRNKMNK